MNRYKIQRWGWRQAWFDVVVWEMEPCLLSDFLTHINPCGGDMNDTRVIRTTEEPTYQFLGGHVWLDLRPFDVVEAIQRENEAFGQFLTTIEHLEPTEFMAQVDQWIASRE